MPPELDWLFNRERLPEWVIAVVVLGYVFREPLRRLSANIFGFLEKKEAAVITERHEKLKAGLSQQSWFDEQLMELLSRAQARLDDDFSSALTQIQQEQREQKHRLIRNNDLLTALNLNLSEVVISLRILRAARGNDDVVVDEREIELDLERNRRARQPNDMSLTRKVD